MNLHVLRRTSAILAFILAAGLVEAATIDFDDLTGMRYVGGTPVPENAKLSDQLLASSGVRFSTEDGEPYAAVVRLGPGHATSGVNGIGSVAEGDILSYHKPISLEFFLPVSPTTPAVTDMVSIKGDRWTSGGWVQMEAFAADGTLLATDTQTDGPPPVLSIAVPGVHSVVLTSERGNVAFDDLVFGELRPAPGSPLAVLWVLGAALEKKLEGLESIIRAEEDEQLAYKQLEEMLASGEYGQLTKRDILKAMQKIHAAMQHQDAALHHLDKSMRFLEVSLDELGAAEVRE